jgi:predicted Zn-dependent protease
MSPLGAAGRGAALSPHLQAWVAPIKPMDSEAAGGDGLKRSLSRACRVLRRPLAAGALALAATHAAVLPGSAGANRNAGLPLIRDAEIEGLVRDYAVPIFRSAGLSGSAVHIYLVNNRAFNAFVAGGQRMFINIGALAEAETPNQLVGVIAHETGHIAGGHLTRLRERLEKAQTMAVVGMLLGVGAMAGGMTSNSSSTAQMGQALMMGTNNVLEHSLLAYQRSEELSADRAGLRFLEATGQSGRGMLDTFRRLAGQSMFMARGADPYYRSHPMPQDRIGALEDLVRKSPHFERRDPAELQLRHDLARAKVAGFLDPPATVLRRYPLHDQSLAARYARAISASEHGDPGAALRQVEELIRAKPNYAFFHEFKGDILLKLGRPREAVAPYRKAMGLAPGAALLRVGLGHALVSTEDKPVLDEAIRELKRGIAAEPEVALAYRALARAYALKGEEGQAMVAAAQGYLSDGDWKSAREQASRAQARLPRGSPAWLQADDIVKARPPRKDGRD